jgi:hypothetical protein
MVFDPEVAPRNRVDFMKWYEAQTQWAEGYSYNDPAVHRLFHRPSRNLRWFFLVRRRKRLSQHETILWSTSSDSPPWQVGAISNK